MSKKTVESVDVAGKRVLIRVDFNVPLKDGKVADDRRVRAALPTIRSVVDRGGRAVLLSHLGRPEGSGYEQPFSLEPVAAHLGELLGKQVSFPSKDCTDDAAAKAVESMGDGDVVLLENLRFHAGEKKGNEEFAKRLASYGDVYVNDAFGTCHREDASMVALPRAMEGRPRVAGLLVEKELAFLSDALREPAKPFVVVLGGAKVADKIPVIEHLLPRADSVLIGGAMAYTFCAALGRRVGDSRVEKDRLNDAKRIIDQAARAETELHFPHDHVCATSFSERAGEIEVFDEHIRDGFLGLDIGPKTASSYALIIRKAKTVVWNGPMGVFEWRPFRVGTRQIATAVASATGSGAVTIVGGGDTAAAAETFEIADKVSHISTGGGASLDLLAGKPFASVELLDDA